MKGNFHVQFLGEGVAATSPPYPTPGWATTQVYPARLHPRGIALRATGCIQRRRIAPPASPSSPPLPSPLLPPLLLPPGASG